MSLTLDDGRVLVAEVRAGSSMGSSHDPALHFGLGGALAVSAEIRWPDGTVEIVADVPVGQRWTREYGSSP